MSAKKGFYEQGGGKDLRPLTLKSIMSANVLALPQDALVMDAMRVIREHGVRHIPIVAEAGGEVVGLVTETDILRSVLHGKSMTSNEQYHATLDMLLPIKEVMVKDVQTLTPQTRVEKAIALFLKKKIRCVPVADKSGKLVGIVTETDLLRLLEDVVAG